MKSFASIKIELQSEACPAIILNKNYDILFANQAYRDAYRIKQLNHKTPPKCYQVSHGYDRPCDQAGEHCPLLQSLQTKQVNRVLHVHHTKSGEEFVNVETTPILNAENDVEYFVEVLRPSTIHKNAQGEVALIGHSLSFQNVLALVERVAPSETTVLLLGETGTGKEIIARTIHERSARMHAPLVPVECTGLPESLFESELFGYVKGAFTGANQDKPGLVEAAEGGTLFLDEIGEIQLSDQVKLLRLLETRRFRRVGSSQYRNADFRLVCATNKNLYELVEQGKFRQDLLFRLNIFEVHLPALRDRGADVLELANTFLQNLSPHKHLSFSQSASQALQTYEFPGNVRELKNCIEHAILMCDGDMVHRQHLPARVLSGYAVPSNISRQGGIKTLAEAEADYLRAVSQSYDGNRKDLAAALGVSERVLYRKLGALK